MYRLCVAVVGLLISQFAYAAGDVDEYAIRQKIRQYNPGISARAETKIFLQHKIFPDFHAADTNFDGIISPTETDEYLSKSASFQRQMAGFDNGRDKPANKPKDAPPADDRKTGEPVKSTAFILRRSFDEVSALASPGNPADATGAQLSYSRDNVALNTAWGLHGVAAVAFTTRYADLSESQRFTPRSSFTVAPYLKFDKVANSNSNLSSKNLDTLTPGVMLELARENVSITGQDTTTHYFRLDGGSTMDFKGVPGSWHIAGEWQPVSNSDYINAPLPIHPFNIALNSIFKVVAEYDSQIRDADQPIFSKHPYALRVGPTVGLKMTPVTLSDFWPKWLQRVKIVTTYSVLQDVYSPATYGTFETAGTYNIDKDGTVGLTASYRRGRVRETGEKLNVIMVGLSSKLGGD